MQASAAEKTVNPSPSSKYEAALERNGAPCPDSNGDISKSGRLGAEDEEYFVWLGEFRLQQKLEKKGR